MLFYLHVISVWTSETESPRVKQMFLSFLGSLAVTWITFISYFLQPQNKNGIICCLMGWQLVKEKLHRKNCLLSSTNAWSELWLERSARLKIYGLNPFVKIHIRDIC